MQKDRASRVFIDKNSINHSHATNVSLKAEENAAEEGGGGGGGGAERGQKTKSARGHFVANRSNNATTPGRRSRPVDLRSDPAIIRDFLPAINVCHVAAAAAGLI